MSRLVVIVLAALLVGYGYGLISYKYDLFPVTLVRYVKERATDDGVNTIGYRDVSNRIMVDCRRVSKDTAVLLTVGQSNSANHGQTRYSPEYDSINFNFFDGKCYRATDPLLGATGVGGSVWTRLSDLLIGRGIVSSVVIAPIGVNASSVIRWTPDGDLHQRITEVLRGLRLQGLEPTHVLWHQGEADAMSRMEGSRYLGALESWIESLRSYDVKAPVFVAVTSMCHNAGSEAIRTAQKQAVARNENVFIGANTDLLDSLTLRYDGCHFSGRGLALHAGLWLDALAQPNE